MSADPVGEEYRVRFAAGTLASRLGREPVAGAPRGPAPHTQAHAHRAAGVSAGGLRAAVAGPRGEAARLRRAKRGLLVALATVMAVTMASCARTTTGAVFTAVSKTIKVESPTNIAITPDGRTAYVTSGYDTVTPINLATGTTQTPIPVGGPGAIAITPDGRTAYVTGYSSSRVTPINLATGTTQTPIRVGYYACEIAIAPDGRTAYVVNCGGGSGVTVLR